MKLVLLSLNSNNESWVEMAVSYYQTKLQKLIKFEYSPLSPSRKNRSQGLKKKEEDSQLLIDALKDEDFVVLCDEKGKQFSSMQFSKEIERLLGSSKKRIVFVIGGPYGASDNLKKRANLTLSFSLMTYNHWVIEIVLLEQIYRAITIQKNLPYHNEG